MNVRRLHRPDEDYAQCSYPKEALRETGWKGYREKRSYFNGKKLCTQHAGITALEHLKETS